MHISDAQNNIVRVRVVDTSSSGPAAFDNGIFRSVRTIEGNRTAGNTIEERPVS